MCDRSARNKNLSDRLFLPGGRYYCKSSGTVFFGKVSHVGCMESSRTYRHLAEECDRLAAIGPRPTFETAICGWLSITALAEAEKLSIRFAGNINARRHLGANAKQI